MKKNTSAKEFSYVGIGRVTVLATQAIFYLVFASLLGPEKYGELNIIIALAATFAVTSRLGLNLSFQVFTAQKQYDISEPIKTLFVLTTSTAALILLIIDPIASLLCIGLSFFVMYQHELLGSHKYKDFMKISVLKSALFFTIPFLFYFLLEIEGIVIGLAVANLIASTTFFKKLKFTSITILKQNYKVLIQNSFIDLSGLAFTLDKLIIAFLFGSFIVGIYQFNLQILFALGTLPLILQSYLISEEAKGETHKKISLLVVLISVIIAISAIILIPFFVNGLFPKYADGITSLQILVLAIIPQSFAAIFNAKLIANKSTKIGYVLLANIPIIFILIVLLGENYGLDGLSYSILLATIFTTIFSFFLYKYEKARHLS